MKRAKVIVLRTAGTNCDHETAFAFTRVGAETEMVHVNELKSRKRRLSEFHILALPGGFTYGDDIASGKILANEIKHTIGSEVEKFLSDGRLIIGICNGFQALVKMGLLPAFHGRRWDMDATLTLNDSARFEDRWCYLKSSVRTACVWTKGLPDMIYLPVAHAEGKFVPKDSAVLGKLKKNRQVVFSYADSGGKKAGYPANPNGSVDAIAGICDVTGRVLGMMPHPERYIRRTQHPRWTREKLRKEGDGLRIFKNGVDFAVKNLL